MSCDERHVGSAMGYEEKGQTSQLSVLAVLDGQEEMAVTIS